MEPPRASPALDSATPPRNDRYAVWLAILVVLVLPFLAFHALWWPVGGSLQSLSYGDLQDQHLAMRTFVAHEYRSGRLPIWSPGTLSGEPSAANSVYAVFYPLGLWEAAFPELPFQALELEILLNLAVAGAFTLLFVREMTGSVGAGLVSGVAFSLGGWMTSYPMLQMIILQVAAWMPATLWLLERSLRRRSLVDAALAGVAFGIGILGGHFQTVLYVAYLSAAYLLFRAVQERVGWRWALAAALTFGGVALGVGAPQLLPSAEIIPLSTRGRLDYETLGQGFRLAEWWGLLRPNPGQWSPLYTGLVTLALGAIAGIAAARYRRSRGQTGFWLAVVLLSLVLSLGLNGPLYPIFYRVMPGFSLFRQQERSAMLVSLALAVLAGLGASAIGGWLRAAGRGRWQRPLLAAAVLALCVDLARVHGAVLEPLAAGGWDAPTPALTAILENTIPEAGRVSSEGLLPLDGNAALRFGYRDVTGNGPLQIAAYERLVTEVPELRWWQMLNVRHLVTQRVLDHPAIRPIAEDAARGQRVYALEIGERDAWITHAARLAGSGDAALTLTADPALDPFAEAILERMPTPEPSPATGPETVRVAGLYPWKVVVEATLSSPGILVASEVDYPGWRVRVDGERAESLRAYGVLRAVALPAGSHVVEWSFRPTSVFVGLGWAALTLAGVAACVLAAVRRNRARRRSVQYGAAPRGAPPSAIDPPSTPSIDRT